MPPSFHRRLHAVRRTDPTHLVGWSAYFGEGTLNAASENVGVRLQSVVNFFPRWYNTERFEEALGRTVSPHDGAVTEVDFVVEVGCKLMVVPIVRLLSLVNQLCAIGKRVRLNFLEGESGAMGYLGRIGFFDHLSEDAMVLPSRPWISGAKMHFGGNSNVVEIEAIGKGHDVEALPNRLESAINSACSARPDVQLLAKSAWQIFSELVDNIDRHSQSNLDGYAALQVYRNGNALWTAPFG